VRFAKKAAEENYLSNLAHVVLKLPCKLAGGKAQRGTGWRQSHSYCLPREVNLLLHTHWRNLIGWSHGFVPVLTTSDHPVVGYGLSCVPSTMKVWGRNQVHRSARRVSRRLLRVGDGNLMGDWEGMLFPDIEAELAYNAMCLT